MFSLFPQRFISHRDKEYRRKKRLSRTFQSGLRSAAIPIQLMCSLTRVVAHSFELFFQNVFLCYYLLLCRYTEMSQAHYLEDPFFVLLLRPSGPAALDGIFLSRHAAA